MEPKRQVSQEAKETPLSPDMSRNKDREQKVVGIIPRWLSTSTWGSVAADCHERRVSLPLYSQYPVNLRVSV